MSEDGSGGVLSFGSYKAFRNTVLFIVTSWVVKNIILDPAATILGLLEWAFDSLINTLDGAVRGALSTAGGAVWDAFLGPSGVITSIQDAMVSAATSAGIASPFAAGLVNLLLVGLVVGVLYLLARAVAGYVTGGVAA